MRRRSSGIFAMFAMLDATWLLLLGRLLLVLLVSDVRDDLRRAARLGQLFFSRLREEMRVDGELLPEIAVAEHLDQRGRARHEPLVLERRDVDRRAGVERLVDVAGVDREDVLLEAPVGEAALGQPPSHRRLTAFEAGLGDAVVTGARLLALGAFAGSLVQAGAVTAAETFLRLGRAFVRPERMQRRSHVYSAA